MDRSLRVAGPSLYVGKIWRRLWRETVEILGYVISHVPGTVGGFLRARFYGWRLRHLGKDARMSVGIEILGPENVDIGNNFYALRNCLIVALDGGDIQIGHNVSFASNVVVDAGSNGIIRIGSDVGIAHNCVLRSSAHRYSDPHRPFKSQGHKPGSIVIEDDVWVAANVILLPGTYLGKGCIVGSGSVVGGTVKSYSVIAGNPARVVGRRG